MRLFIHRLILAVTMATSLFHLPEGVVILCQQESGQVAIEFSHGGLLHDGPASGASGTPCRCGEGCGPCRDTQVGPDELLASAAAPARAPGTALLTAVAPPPPVLDVWLDSLLRLPRPVEPSPNEIHSRRTSVLLI